MTTIAARFVLREPVSGLRWFGVVLIILGAGVITYTEKIKERPAVPQSPRAPAP
jgi:drug/metabolite transporter (DMT)-like permease